MMGNDQQPPTGKMRPNLFRRLLDGVVVKATDLPDGDTSWMVYPFPVIASARIVGTMKTKRFDQLHEEIAS